MVELRAVADATIDNVPLASGAWAEPGELVARATDRKQLRFRARGLQSDLARLSDGLSASAIPATGSTGSAPVAGRLLLGASADPTRIAAFGFSAGGFTVLTAVGAKPDLSRIAPHCAATPEFACQVLEAAHSPLRSGTVAPIDLEFFVDSRLRAAVVAAPGLGFTFGEHAFDEVRVPVQLWTGGLDTSVPDDSNGAAVRAGLAGRVEAHAEPGASHLTFLTPCSLLQPAPFCSDANGFDRRDFHRRMNDDVLRFLAAALSR